MASVARSSPGNNSVPQRSTTATTSPSRSLDVCSPSPSIPKTRRTIYVGSAQGGIWKTTDGGKHWKPLSDFEPSLAINYIAIDSKNPNIIFAGTGEDNLSCDSYQGLGILRSTDAGAHWSV